MLICPPAPSAFPRFPTFQGPQRLGHLPSQFWTSQRDPSVVHWHKVVEIQGSGFVWNGETCAFEDCHTCGHLPSLNSCLHVCNSSQHRRNPPVEYIGAEPKGPQQGLKFQVFRNCHVQCAACRCMQNDAATAKFLLHLGQESPNVWNKKWHEPVQKIEVTRTYQNQMRSI